MTSENLQRFSAFADTPDGGNPAGVWIGDELPDEAAMLAIAADVGYSETVFATKSGGEEYAVRYFSPSAEVPFCGHATIALGARLAADVGSGVYQLRTSVGDISLSAEWNGQRGSATLTSVEPWSKPADVALVNRVLELLGWSSDALDPALTPALTYGGAIHLLLALNNREQLGQVTYGFDDMKAVMLDNDLTTVNIVWRESENVFHSRNLFPVGGIVEDPATGAAAAALGGHLREIGAVAPAVTLTVHQGDDMGRPSVIRVAIPKTGGIDVAGNAVRIDG